jgi:hypothetical protein
MAVANSKDGWREICGVRKYYRSLWEINYAHYLQWLKERGEIQPRWHKPKEFWFESIRRGVRSYKPDFEIVEKDGRIVYH